MDQTLEDLIDKLGNKLERLENQKFDSRWVVFLYDEPDNFFARTLREALQKAVDYMESKNG